MKIYDDMFDRNYKHILNSGFRFDPVLNHDYDPRRCLALYNIFNQQNTKFTPRFISVMDYLKQVLGPHHIYYNINGERGKLHWTCLQLIKFGSVPTDLNQSDILHVKSICQTHLKKMTLHFMGLIVVPTGIVMVGRTLTDVNVFRDLLRKNIPFIDEPYKNDIIHSTIVRFVHEIDISALEKLSTYCRENIGQTLLKCTIDSLTISEATWKMNKALDAIPKTIFSLASTPAIISHRGLEPMCRSFWSESSFEAFCSHLDRGFSIEFDPMFTTDGIIIVHDSTTLRLTGESLQFKSMSTSQALSVRLERGRMCTLEELLCKISLSDTTTNALHLKGDRQTPNNVSRLCKTLGKFPLSLNKLIIFDLRLESAQQIKVCFPNIRLSASVSHESDIKRFNSVVHDTLFSIDQLIEHKSLFEWAWLDEWDLTDKEPFISSETFIKLRRHGFKLAVVSPELHGTSPGRLANEVHPDSVSISKLMLRWEQILGLAPDAICTDYINLCKKCI